MIEFGTEIAPEGGAMSRSPPGCKEHIHQKERTEHARESHPKSNELEDPDQKLGNAHEVSEENCVGQNDTGQEWTIETAVRSVVLQIGLKSAVGKTRSCKFVIYRTTGRKWTLQCAPKRSSGTGRWKDSSLAECCVRVPSHADELASGAIIRHVLLQRVQFMAQVINTPLEKIPDGENAQQLTVVIGNWQMAEVAFQHDA